MNKTSVGRSGMRTSSRRTFLATGVGTAAGLFAATLLKGCGGEVVGPGWYVIQADTTPEGGFTATLPDGTIYTDTAVFLSQVPERIKAAQAAGLEVRFELGTVATYVLVGSMTNQSSGGEKTADVVFQRQSALRYDGGNFVITGGWDWGYVSGCVKRNALKYAFRCNDRYQKIQYFDLHIAFWRQGTQLCIGLYESVRNLVNKCSCDPEDQNKIYRELVDFLRGLRIDVSTAATIATVLTAACYAILVFA